MRALNSSRFWSALHILGEALVQEAAASGQFTQQKRGLVYEWLFPGLACCFLPRIHDCELNCSCWFITSLLGYKVGLLSNSSLGKKHNNNNTTSAANSIPLAQKVPPSLGWYFTSTHRVAIIKTKHVLWMGRIWAWFPVFGWTPELSFKTSWTHPFQRMLLAQCSMHYISCCCCHSPDFSVKLHMNLLLETGTLCWPLMKHFFWSLKERAVHVKVKAFVSSCSSRTWSCIAPGVGSVGAVLQSTCCKSTTVTGNRVAPPLPP